ncbi:HNH endonuclease [Cellulomonas rhizosphaerae]|uniref:HNH endonuclease n=2 Tax=Cellulomonas rhizosphaerae TaxID=2293719 RepID=A0A413RKR8_9CELL|nr:HNH endonuclease [Cellulomonas rhizosphaerae]
MVTMAVAYAEPMLEPAVGGLRYPRFPVAAVSPMAILELVESTPVADLAGPDLIAVIAAWDQVQAIGAARQAEAAREIAARGGLAASYADDEIASALACTRQAAQALVLRAEALGREPALNDGLLNGMLDVRKVDAILAEVATLVNGPVRDGIVREAAERGGSLTAPQLRRHVRQAVLLADPETAAKREVAARDERRVEVQWMPDSMVWLSAYLPAADGITVMTVLDALADSRVPGETRTADQLRADALVDLFGDVLDRGELPCGRPLPQRKGRRTSVEVAVGAGTLLGLDENPGFLAGYGPIPAPVARALAQDATWSRLLHDAVTGAILERSPVRYRPGVDLTGLVTARDRTCRFPGCRRPAMRCELDHRVPFDPSRPAEDQTTASNLDCLCKHHHQAKTDGAWTPRRDPVSGVMTWTSAMGITYSRAPDSVIVLPSARGRRPEQVSDEAEDIGPPPF